MWRVWFWMNFNSCRKCPNSEWNSRLTCAFPVPISSHSFQATDLPLDVCWSGNLLSISPLNSQITRIFSTIWGFTTGTSWLHSLSFVDARQSLGSRQISGIYITKQGKMKTEENHFTVELYFLLGNPGSLTFDPLVLLEPGQSIGEILQALSLILRCWPYTAWCNLGCTSFLRLDKLYWGYCTAADFMKVETEMCNYMTQFDTSLTFPTWHRFKRGLSCAKVINILIRDLRTYQSFLIKTAKSIQIQKAGTCRTESKTTQF